MKKILGNAYWWNCKSQWNIYINFNWRYCTWTLHFKISTLNINLSLLFAQNDISEYFRPYFISIAAQILAERQVCETLSNCFRRLGWPEMFFYFHWTKQVQWRPTVFFEKFANKGQGKDVVHPSNKLNSPRVHYQLQRNSTFHLNSWCDF